ncbi:MAG: hypothetical protein KME30_30995 [Iphinoe sp. HA4291-MV1]|nr:hypothetical protein [Iphinoe sp. HA4291-MV1]
MGKPGEQSPQKSILDSQRMGESCPVFLGFHLLVFLSDDHSATRWLLGTQHFMNSLQPKA